MTAVLLGDYSPNSPEWHEARATRLGASEIASVVGLSPFESAFSLWHRKKGNLPGPDPENPLFYWGHALEPVVAEKFKSEHGYTVSTAGTYAHSERPWQLANLDRALTMSVTASVIPLEIKTTRFGDGYGPTGTDQIPVHVRCQVMQQMDVFSAPYAWVAVLIGGNDYREYKIPFREDDAITLREAGELFMASLATDDEPPIDASFDTYQSVKDLHPDIDGSDVEIDPEVYAEYHVTKNQYDAANTNHRKAKSELLAAMGDARRALYFGKPVLRRQPSRNGVALYPIKEAS